STLKVGDNVNTEETIYHDADVTRIGYEYGHMPRCPAGFKADDNLIAASQSFIESLNMQ
ncbi:5'-methylthioadenosine/S-adenosylhomocysteine nucleosidase, partial [Raoultella ornithinolytica]|nr:5'-methylthioadenosine/S-adenosylhomocysteine nucleosidase [Raoultella ornithinolytica]